MATALAIGIVIGYFWKLRRLERNDWRILLQYGPLHRTHDIFSRDYAVKVTPAINYRQTLDPVLDHEFKHALKVGFTVDGNDIAGHDFVDRRGHAFLVMRQDMVLRKAEDLEGVKFGYHANQRIAANDRIGVE